MKTITITKCKVCPYFCAFPADFFEGDCSHKEARSKNTDTRITDKDAIPTWCPL